MDNLKLGDLNSSEQLIKELYLDLRKNTIKWSEITAQTPQARMGYIGQHLTSIVTGFRGGKSGARGYDLILGNNEFGEIKTCYRVDQLGNCKSCNNVVSSIETECSYCKSKDIERKDDSKWLITMSNYEDYSNCLDPKYYYLVLFEFEDLNSATNRNIIAKIWRVDTKNTGFAYCMIDYWHNIKSHSKSAAPFNCWPHQIKFYLMKPYLIYHSVIKEDNTIDTIIFPNRDECNISKIEDFTIFNKAKTLTTENLSNTIKELSSSHYTCNIKNKTKLDLLKELNNLSKDIDYDIIINTLVKNIYLPLIKPHISNIPHKISKEYIDLK